MKKFTLKAAMLGATALIAAPAIADQVFVDDVIVQGSLCVGIDCVNGESFGFDTLRLKENNLRIKAQDTSTSASFPSNDWQITFNDSSNGGLNKYSIVDVDANRAPFTIEAGARVNSVYVENSGEVGFGTNEPVTVLHARTGNTPTLRLEQDGSNGFTPQTWDMASNESNFFIRDATNGSTLPFRIQPSAPSNALYIANNGRIGLGTTSPSNNLHMRDSGGVSILFDSSDNTDAGNDLRLSLIQDGGGTGVEELRAIFIGVGEVMSLDETGTMTLTGGLITTGGGGACTVADPCDAVFDPEIYTVPTIEAHGAEMWANKRLPALDPVGPDHTLDVTKTLVRMLNELEHAHIFIQQLNDRVKELETEIDQG